MKKLIGLVLFLALLISLAPAVGQALDRDPKGEHKPSRTDFQVP